MSEDKLSNMIDMASRIFSRWRVNAIEIEKHPELFAFARNEIADLSDAFDALRAELTAAKAAADPDLSDYYTPTVVVTELQHEVDALRAERDAALAAVQWQPVSHGFGVCTTERNPDELHYTELDGKRYISIFMHPAQVAYELPDDIALMRRNPASKVWRPVAEGVTLNGGIGEVYQTRVDGLWWVTLTLRALQMALPLPPGKALCELVAADGGEGDA